jgi:serine/threonine protein kinase
LVKKIGHYEVEKEIGRGAMGVVYLAHDPRVRRRLAVKTYELPKGIDAEEAKERRERFIREAQSAGALNHPSIVTIYDVDQDAEEGSTYIAMEYVPGRSLQGFLRGAGRLDGTRAVQLGTTLAEALHVAHGSGVVHRDIKPGNILIRDADGMFKLADFGIARFSDSELTLEGVTLGSPAYMSPEQIRSEDVDGRSDLFSLASVLYEAFTGKRPFEGKDLPSLAYAVAHNQPRPVRELVAELPGSLDRFFTKAMAKDPEGRYQDGKSFAAALHLAWERRIETVSDSSAGQAGSPGSSAATEARPHDPRETEGESPSGSYKPRAPRQILQRNQEEQTLSALDIIPLNRSFGRKEERINGRSRWTDPEAETAQQRAALKGIGFGRTAWVRLLLLAALVAGGMAAVDRWKSLPPPVPGSVILEVTSSLDAATLRVFSDGNLLYVGGMLEGGDSVGEPGSAGVDPSIAVSSGEHLFLVHVSPRGGNRSYQEQVKAHVRPGETHRLHVVTGTNENPMPTLKFD